jgi:N6-adenosine-specific RNA methylase IME4
MEEAFVVVKSWGFKQKTILTWTKVKKDGAPSMKMGYYYRGATEHCLFCVRGKQRLIGPAAPTAIFASRLPHSVKPPEFYKLVEEQSPSPVLEMFARRSRPGWHTWGNELHNDVEIGETHEVSDRYLPVLCRHIGNGR